jgi:hypothetical protein
VSGITSSDLKQISVGGKVWGRREQLLFEEERLFADHDDRNWFVFTDL